MAQLDLIPELLDPHFINHLKAKSYSKGGDTLAQHTWAVLCRLSDQYQLRGAQFVDLRQWHQLFWGCFLHDFGKAAMGFQERLQEPPIDNEWADGRHRHEVLSLAFVDALFPGSHPDRFAIIGIVATHHRDVQEIREKYGGVQTDTHQKARIEFLINQLLPSNVPLLWQWMTDYAVRWAEVLKLPVLEIPCPENYAINAEHIRRALSDLSSLYTQFNDSDDSPYHWWHRIVRGLILTADHAASSGVAPFPPMPTDLGDRISKSTTQKNRSLYPHQIAASKSMLGSAVLISPTGSGKTEAALLWVKRQMELLPAPRIFYTLPYQASMNAMALRLTNGLFQVSLTAPENTFLAIQHSRATLKYYQEMMEDEDTPNPKSNAAKARTLKDKARLNWYPIQVFSPYQMLKAAFSLKGYEAQLVDYAGALFIFDEIHAYDPARLALILEMMGWMHKNLNARFLVMTATLPPVILEQLKIVLNQPQMITANEQVFRDSQRHTIHMREGSLLEHLDDAYQDWSQGNNVLICCNTIQRAQEAYERLKKRGLQHKKDILLLHGRFNGRDRSAYEILLTERVGVTNENRNQNPLIVVATQVVEVSLNIDLDVLYTEPAPLEALLQRFGRINRGRGRGASLLPVYVFGEPSAEGETLPYDHLYISRALEVLRTSAINGPFAVDEALVSAMLAEIYQGDLLKAWETKYYAQATLMRQQLAAMVPYKSADDELKRAFYKNFDGTQVLPTACYDAYIAYINNRDYLGASQYLVNISWGQYQMLKKQCKIREKEDKEFVDHVIVPYDSEYGLKLQRDQDE